MLFKLGTYVHITYFFFFNFYLTPTSQLFVAVRVLGMTPDVLQAGEGLPVAEFAIALNSGT